MSNPSPPQDTPAAASAPDQAAPTPGSRNRASFSLVRVAGIAIAVALVAALIGFGWALGWHEPLLTAFKPELAPASGRITYQGKPVDVGFVTAIPDNSLSENALGALGPDGEFELSTNGVPGVAIGTHRLLVQSMTTDFPPKSITPERYADLRTTPLRITVGSDAEKNVFEFDLTQE